MTERLLSHKERFYTPTMVLLAIVVAVSFLGVGFIVPLRTLYAHELGASSAEIGLMTVSFLVASFVAAPVIGHLSDRYGAKNVLWIGLLVHGAVVLIYLPVRSPIWLIGLRAIEGIATVAILPPARTLMSILAPTHRQAEALGIVSAAQNAGILLGPVLGALVASAFGYGPSFLLVSTLLALMTVAAYRFLPRPAVASSTKTARQEPTQRLFRFPLLLVYFLGLLLMLSTGVIATIWSLYMLDRGASLLLIGLSYTAVGLPQLVLTPLAGRWSDRYGRYGLTICGVSLLGLVYTAYGVVSSPLWIVFLCGVEGVFHALAESGVNGLLADVTPAGREGTVQAHFNAARTAGSLLGATVAGFFYAVGPGVPFLMTGPWYVFGTVILFLPSFARMFARGRSRKSGSKEANTL